MMQYEILHRVSSSVRSRRLTGPWGFAQWKPSLTLRVSGSSEIIDENHTNPKRERGRHDPLGKAGPWTKPYRRARQSDPTPERRWRAWCTIVAAIACVATITAAFSDAALIAGAEEPTITPLTPADQEWERLMQERLRWWSLQPVARPSLPLVRDSSWCRTELDRFVLARLEAAGLRAAPEAGAGTLQRRLSFALLGLPLRPGEVASFLSDNSPSAYESLVDRLLDSPHFGERWARHWMDVVHYADTHGYEWDVEAKGAWMYRDYLVRAFNRDVPFRQLIMEHVAGDLLDAPRIDAESNLNESLIGTVALRLGERRHGDSAEFEGIHQEAMENVIDTVTKAFQATTVACARCHDHKLDALSQHDYYALAGAFMSSRWVCRSANARNPNRASISELRRIKESLRIAVAEAWLEQSKLLGRTLLAAQAVIDKVPEAPEQAAQLPAQQLAAWTMILAGKPEKPEQTASPWCQTVATVRGGVAVADAWQATCENFKRLRNERAQANSTALRLVADFSNGSIDHAGLAWHAWHAWHAEGFGLDSELASNGDIIVADSGTEAVRQIVRAGLYTHCDSARLAGALRSPLLTPDTPFLSFELMGGGLAARHVVVDNALFPESRYQFIDQPGLTWHTVSALPGETSKGRRVYIELCTKGLNNYYPPRTGLVSKYSPEQQADPRSWFGVTRVYAHAEPGQVPQDELSRYARLFEGPAPASLDEAAERIGQWLQQSIERWRDGRADPDDALLVEWIRQSRLLTNRIDANERIASLVARYRAVESQLQPDSIVGGVADYAEGRDDRLGIRGSYTELTDPISRGPFQFISHLGRPGKRADCGRLQLAEAIANPDNPLTARVFVNRVWQWLFGTGLVTTCDDFGHLGEMPSHPELLDYLATRFMEEGWSLKKLVRMIVLSSTWRQSGSVDGVAVEHDPANRLWHHYPTRRLEAEAIRDSMLTVSGRLDDAIGGPAIDPYRRAEDKDKRLYSGPVDGFGRRSIYTKMTLMEPPRFLAIFNQPIPKLTVGHRDVTNVPEQALALLNDPFVLSQAHYWADRLVAQRCDSIEDRVELMWTEALGRAPDQDERSRCALAILRFAELHDVPPEAILADRAVWQDFAHALFSLKEFIYVR
jgi:hypothetical protein